MTKKKINKGVEFRNYLKNEATLKSHKSRDIKTTKMKKIILMTTMLLTFGVANAQKVAKVTITSKISITDALEKCKEAGKKAKYGSRDYEANVSNGKVTLWQSVGRVNPFDFYCQVDATFKDGITTLSFRLPHNPNAIANYIKELKKITTKLQLPEMMVGEYFDGIE